MNLQECEDQDDEMELEERCTNTCTLEMFDCIDQPEFAEAREGIAALQVGQARTAGQR